jgi:hypothetical protein
LHIYKRREYTRWVTGLVKVEKRRVLFTVYDVDGMVLISNSFWRDLISLRFVLYFHWRLLGQTLEGHYQSAIHISVSLCKQTE